MGLEINFDNFLFSAPKYAPHVTAGSFQKESEDVILFWQVRTDTYIKDIGTGYNNKYWYWMVQVIVLKTSIISYHHIILD